MNSPTYSDRHQLHWIFWPVLLGAILLSTSIPWYLGLLDVDIQLVLWGLLGCAVAFSLFLEWQLQNSEAGSLLVRGVPYLVGAGLLSAIWFKLGALSVPSFLILFGIPVVGAAMSSRGWLEYGVASLSVILVALIALSTNPALYWYLDRLSLLPEWLNNSLLLQFAERSGSVMVDAGRETLIVVSFTVGMFATAVLGSTIGGLLRTLTEHLQETLKLSAEVQAYADSLVDSSDQPMLVVSHHHGLILRANAAFSEFIGEADAELGKAFLEVIRPVYPEELVASLEGYTAAEISRVACRVNERYELLDFATSVAHEMNDPVIQVRFRRSPDGDLALSALDDLEEGLIILNPDQRIIFANQTVQMLFPECTPGDHADDVLNNAPGLPDAWWRSPSEPRKSFVVEQDDAQYVIGVLRATAKAGASLTYIRISGDARGI